MHYVLFFWGGGGFLRFLFELNSNAEEKAKQSWFFFFFFFFFFSLNPLMPIRNPVEIQSTLFFCSPSGLQLTILFVVD